MVLPETTTTLSKPAAAEVEVANGTAARTVGVGVGLGIVGTVLTYGYDPALGFVLYVFLLLGALLISARMHKTPFARQNWILLVAVLFFSVMLAIRADDTLGMLNLAAAIFAALLLVYHFANGSVVRQNLLEGILNATVSGGMVWIQPFGELIKAVKWLTARRSGWPTIMPFVRGLIITIPVVVIFALLLSSADAVFGDLVSRILNIFTFHNVDSIVSQSVVAGVLGWTAIGGLSFAVLDRKSKRAPRPLDPPILAVETETQTAPIFSLGFTESTMLLGGVCSVFAAFVAVQFVYLFGGVRNIEIGKFNYADYVHRGFAELVIVAVLTLGLAYTLNVIAIRKSKRQLQVLRLLLTVMIVLTGVILVSAFQRLRLYEEAYGFTTLRLTIYVFIVWLGVLFASFATSLYWQPHMINVFGLTTLIAALGFVATLDIINPDAFIAREMIERHDVDPSYLVSLSDEAIPAMVTLVDAPEKGLRDLVRLELGNRQNRLSYGDNRDWRGYNVGRRNASAAILTVQDNLLHDNRGYLHTLDDFKFLKAGLSYREVLRQAGLPSYSSASNNEYAARRSDRDLLKLRYALSDSSTMFITIDTVNGVTAACVGASETQCISLLN